MSINPLPPQAYTKDTLAKAFQWLQGQPEEVKSLAKSSDLLVGLYLKANRDGAQVLQGKSFQNFRAELKNLAEMVEDFAPPSPSQQQQQAAAPQAPLPTASSTASQVLSSQEQNFARLEGYLDAKTMQYLELVQKQLNLSSPMEALRMLVTLGFEKVKSLF
jgi:hypothetical protein